MDHRVVAGQRESLTRGWRRFRRSHPKAEAAFICCFWGPKIPGWLSSSREELLILIRHFTGMCVCWATIDAQYHFPSEMASE